MASSTASGSTSRPTLQDWTYRLRSGFRDGSKSGLADLENAIQELGYNWLDDYMNGVMSRASSSAPITQLIKTPSRTATTKKTRATTAAGKERTEKLKNINAQGSPISKTSSNVSRLPLSPLGERAMNTASPKKMILLSPSKPMKVDSKGKGKQKEAKVKGASKKGKSKKVVEAVQEEPVVEEPVDVEMVPSDAPQDLPAASPQPMDIPVDIVEDEPAQQTEETKDEEIDEPVEEEEVIEPVPQAVQVVESVEIQTTTTITSSKKVIDLSMINEEEDSHSSSRARIKDIEETVYEDAMDLDEVAEQPSVAAAESDPIVANESTEEIAKVSEEEDVAEPKETETQPNAKVVETPKEAEVTAARIVPAAPPVPTRQVRSSWLSKALGTGTVPIGGLPNADGTARESFRKSIAASALRQSMAPIGGFKRKSEAADDDEEDLPRPEKITRMEEPPRKVDNTLETTSSVLPKPAFERSTSRENGVRESIFPRQTTILPSTTPGPRPASAMSTASTEHQDSQERPLYKVSKALEELRERQHAEKAAKTKAAAALAASSGPKQRPSSVQQPVTTGTGFLRGLGNIGAGLGRSLGLGGNVKSGEEEEIARIQREEEEAEQRRVSLEAKEALQKLLLKSPEKVVEEVQAPTEEETLVKNKTSLSSRASSPHAALAGLAGAIDDAMESEEEEDVDMNDEKAVLEGLDDLHPVDSESEGAAKLTTKPTKPVVPHSPPRAPRAAMVSTTPMGTPPRTTSVDADAPPIHARQEKHQPPSPSRIPKPPTQAALPPKEKLLVKHDSDMSIHTTSQESSHPTKPSQSIKVIIPPKSTAAPAPSRPVSRATTVEENPLVLSDDTEPEQQEEIEIEQEQEDDDTARFPAQQKRVLSKSSSQHSLAMSTTSSSGMFGHASTIAGKVLGVKPVAGQVKSLQAAQAAAKKDQMAASDRKALREAAEQRRKEQAERKAEQERIKAEEDRKARVAEVEEKKRIRAEQERRRREAEERKMQLAREKAAKEEKVREAELAAAAAAKAKMDEENAKKRKLAQQQQALNKSVNAAPAPASALKKIIPTTAGSIVPIGATGGSSKDPFRIAKPATTGSKVGPTGFRTEQIVQSQSSTITLVTQSQSQAQPIRALGPPSRPSAMQGGSAFAQQHMRSSVAVSHTQHAVAQGNYGTVLQQSRVALQTQLDQQANEQQSEDIDLPDINSEYSDPDDDDRSRDFDRPAWAESPELRAALAQQASRDPDELFGPIKPLNMEELFNIRTTKFRARTSSAIWHKGDGLTKAEEVEYARRMGFKPLPNNGNNGATFGPSGGR